MKLYSENLVYGEIIKIDCNKEICQVTLKTKSGKINVISSKHFIEIYSLDTNINVNILINPIDVYVLKMAKPDMGASNILHGRIRAVVLTGLVTAVTIDTDSGEFISLMSTDEWKKTELEEGSQACVAFKAAACRITTVDDENPGQKAFDF